MIKKRRLENRIRGWLPQEPKFPRRNSPIQLPPTPKPLRKKWSLGLGILLPAVSAFVAITLVMQISLTAIALLVVIFAFLIGVALLSRTSKQKIYRFFKYGTVFMMSLCIVFAVLRIFLFSTSGYPPTLVPQTSYPQILDASLTDYLKDVEDSAGYRFLQAEHLGTVSFAGLSISTTYSNSPGHLGGLLWSFYANDVNVKVNVGQTTGFAYQIMPINSNLFRGNPIPANFPSPQNVSASLEQIDALGLRWFHNQAVDRYKNESGSNPTIANLHVNIAFDEDYNGMTLMLSAGYPSTDQRGNLIYQSYFTAEFQPNGTFLNFSVHQPNIYD